MLHPAPLQDDKPHHPALLRQLPYPEKPVTSLLVVNDRTDDLQGRAHRTWLQSQAHWPRGTGLPRHHPC